MNDKRRIKIVVLTETMLNVLLRQEATIRCMAGVPIDAKLLGMNTNFRSLTIEVAYEHPSFDEVDIAVEAPKMYVAFEIVDHPGFWHHDSYVTSMSTGPKPEDHHQQFRFREGHNASS